MKKQQIYLTLVNLCLLNVKVRYVVIIILRVLVLINTKATSATVKVSGVTGKKAKIIDSLVGNEAARESTLASDTVELGSFAVMFVQF